MSTATLPSTPLPTIAVEASPIDRLTASFAGWASNPHRVAGTIEGHRLLIVLRVLARPAYRINELQAEADRLDRLARCRATDGWEGVHRRASRAEWAVSAAYSTILSDIDLLFTALTGVSADSDEALSLEVPMAQLAANAQLLLAVA